MLTLSLSLQGIFVVYDITCRRSFDNLDFWVSNIKEVSVPGGEVSVPGGEISVPGGEVSVPGGEVSVPGGEVSVPGGEVSVPGGEVSVPGGKLVYLEGSKCTWRGS